MLDVLPNCEYVWNKASVYSLLSDLLITTIQSILPVSRDFELAGAAEPMSPPASRIAYCKP